MKKWFLIFIVVFMLTLALFWGLSWLTTPANAHGHHHHGHFRIWIGPPVFWAPPPVYYRPYYQPPYGYPGYYPPAYYPRYYREREWVPGHWEWDSYWSRWLWIPGY